MATWTKDDGSAPAIQPAVNAGWQWPAKNCRVRGLFSRSLAQSARQTPLMLQNIWIIKSLRAWLLRIAGFSPDAKRYLLACGLLGIGSGAAWVHLNLWYKTLGMQEDRIGTMLAVSAIGGTLVALPAAVWVDKLAPGRVLALCAGGFAVSLAVPLLWPVPAILMVCALLNGMLFTVHWVAAAPFFMRTATAEDRPDLFGLAHALETVATMAAAWGVGALAGWGHAAWGTERAGLEFGIGCAAVVAFASAPLFARITLQPEPGADQRGWRDQLRARDWPLLAKLTVPAALVGLGAGLIIPFLNLYFRQRFDLQPQRIGSLFAVGQVFTTVGFLVGPAMARRFGPVQAIVATELLSIPFFLTLAYAQDLRLAVAAFWIRGALMQMNQPISTAFAMEQVPADQQAVTNSARQLAWNLAWTASTQLGGVWIARSGFEPPILAAVVLYVMASASFAWFFGRKVKVSVA